MDDANLSFFESIVRSVGRLSDTSARPDLEHPFEQRDIHDDFPTDVRRLFDNAHFAQATLEAFKFVEEEIQRRSGSSEFGRKLMFDVFNEGKPLLRLNPMQTTSQIGEQEGYKFIFGGAAAGIRNPRAHTTQWPESMDECLDHLCLASLLLRKLDRSGLR